MRQCKQGHGAITDENAMPYQKDGKTYYNCRECRREQHRQHMRRINMGAPAGTTSVMASYKEPLKSVENGHGYYGTLSYDKETQQYTQCHLCGNFYTALHSHVFSGHNISVSEYKDKFSLPVTLSLYAPKAAIPQHVNWAKMTDEERKARVAQLTINRAKGMVTRTAKEKGHPRRGKSLYYKNIEGRCPDQLLDKIQELADELGRTPSRREFAAKHGSGFQQSVCLTFGSWSQAIIILGMTVRTAPGRQCLYTKEALAELIRDFRERYEREPFAADCKRGLLPDQATFAKHFGSWAKAKEDTILVNQS